MMEKVLEYSKKYGLPEYESDYGEKFKTSAHSIAFDNGWVASIAENHGISVHLPGGGTEQEFLSDKKYSVAMCDYNHFFNWKILNRYGAIEGRLFCDTEQEIIDACEVIRTLYL